MRQALLDLKVKYTSEVQAQAQKAFNLGYTSTLKKYKIETNEAEKNDDEEDGGEVQTSDHTVVEKE